MSVTSGSSPRNGNTNNTNIIYLPWFFFGVFLTNTATASSVFGSCPVVIVEYS